MKNTDGGRNRKPSLSRQKSRVENIQWLQQRCTDWKSPSVVYKDPSFGAGYEPLNCRKMDVNVECYLSTAVVNIHGEWVNNTNARPIPSKFIFVLSPRGSITNCTIRISGDNHSYVRTVAIVSGEQIRQNTQIVKLNL